ncbi:LOW QUALITY PROTEIN: hypothetical protein PHMEG_0005281 [Phytophthora megakarya]|uniref:Uncharacterized protein n=1 Tax=Phytophthora megakarya TaxID=4795 RepID=A0A225WRV7_9STRA|nr:LOW QUALITY PROTEIN: hypothetical protein PHMEG_0005281 [Phytophthora megakarya]
MSPPSSSILRGARFYGTIGSQPALSTGEDKGITATEVARTLKRAATSAGLDAKSFSTLLVRKGLMYYWLSSAYEEYPVLTLDGQENWQY